MNVHVSRRVAGLFSRCEVARILFNHNIQMLASDVFKDTIVSVILPHSPILFTFIAYSAFLVLFIFGASCRHRTKLPIGSYTPGY